MAATIPTQPKQSARRRSSTDSPQRRSLRNRSDAKGRDSQPPRGACVRPSAKRAEAGPGRAPNQQPSTANSRAGKPRAKITNSPKSYRDILTNARTGKEKSHSPVSPKPSRVLTPVMDEPSSNNNSESQNGSPIPLKDACTSSNLLDPARQDHKTSSEHGGPISYIASSAQDPNSHRTDTNRVSNDVAQAASELTSPHLSSDSQISATSSTASFSPADTSSLSHTTTHITPQAHNTSSELVTLSPCKSSTPTTVISAKRKYVQRDWKQHTSNSPTATSPESHSDNETHNMHIQAPQTPQEEKELPQTSYSDCSFSLSAPPPFASPGALRAKKIRWTNDPTTVLAPSPEETEDVISTEEVDDPVVVSDDEGEPYCQDQVFLQDDVSCDSESYISDKTETESIPPEDVPVIMNRKSVRFAETLVTDTWTRPKLLSSEVPFLFYSPEDERRFRAEYHDYRRSLIEGDVIDDEYSQDYEYPTSPHDDDPVPHDDDASAVDYSALSDLLEIMAENEAFVVGGTGDRCSPQISFSSSIISKAVVVHDGTVQTYYPESPERMGKLSGAEGINFEGLTDCDLPWLSDDNIETAFFDNHTFWNGTVTWY